MTRQKKEILKKIQELEYEINMDYALSFNNVPDHAHDDIYDEIFYLWEEFAQLSGFSCRWEQEEFEHEAWCHAHHKRYDPQWDWARQDLPWL